MKYISKDLRDVEKEAKKLEDSLSAYDFKSNHYVHISTEEGCEHTVASAFVLTHGDWYIIFSEHHDFMIFGKDDVTKIYEFKILYHKNSEFTEIDDFKPVKLDKQK